MPQITPDQFDDMIDTAQVFVDNGDDWRPPEDGDVPHDPRLRLLADINELLAQDNGSAGTHAYEMIAAVEEINAGNTRTLIELVAGAVLHVTFGKEEGVQQISTSFGPSDIDDMQRNYVFDVKRDGLMTTVTLTKKAEPSDSWVFGENIDPGEAREQAAERPERPVWAIGGGCDADMRPVLQGPFQNREKAVERLLGLPDGHFRIENRYCMHPECPSTGCTHPEVTSPA